MVYPDYQSVESAETRRSFEELWGVPLDPQKGLTVVEIVHAIHRGEIKGMYIMGENPAMSDPDLKHAREAFAALEHLVVQEIFLTETACYADVVLPATAFPEKTGTFTNTDRRVQLGRQALPPPGEARPDWEIHPGNRRTARLALGLSAPARRLRRDAPGDAFAPRDHLGPTRTRRGGDVSVRLGRRAGPRRHLRRRLPDPDRRASSYPPPCCPPTSNPMKHTRWS